MLSTPFGSKLCHEFVNLYFPYAGWGLLCFVCLFVFCADGSGILNSNRHMWQWKEEAMLRKTHIRDTGNFKSHLWWDFSAYWTRPVSVHLVIVCVSCLFDSFSMVFLSLKQQQNLMKIMFSCIHFAVWSYPPPMKTIILYQWTVWVDRYDSII